MGTPPYNVPDKTLNRSCFVIHIASRLEISLVAAIAALITVIFLSIDNVNAATESIASIDTETLHENCANAEAAEDAIQNAWDQENKTVEVTQFQSSKIAKEIVQQSIIDYKEQILKSSI